MALAQRKLQRIGNSTGVLLSAEIMADAGFQRDSSVVVHAEHGRVTLTLLDTEVDRLCQLAESVIADHPTALRRLAE